MTRLAYVCADPGIPFDGSKGASVHLRAITSALRAAGAELRVFVSRPSKRAFDRVRLIAPPDGGDAIGRELAQLGGGARMLEALEEEGPFDAVLERLALFAAGGSAYAARHGVPHLIEVNAPLWEEAARYRSLRLRECARALALETLAGAALVLAVSPALAEDLEAAGLDPSRIRVLPNGVDGEAFARARPLPRPEGSEGRPLLLFHGSLKPWHGLEFLIEALESAGDPRDPFLWVLGDGPLRGLVEEAASKNPRRIRYGGAVLHEDVPRALLAADFACIPYPGEAPDYFCPLKLVESLALRRPILASEKRCVTDFLEEGTRAFLFRPGDRDSFRDALSRALDAWEHGETRAAGEPPDPERTWASKAERILAWVREFQR